MSPEFKDWLQAGAWGIAIVGGLVTASKAVTEMRRSNAQRLEDMRWKRAEMAKKCLDEMFGNSLARAAMKMLDWTGLTYNTPDGKKTGEITSEARRFALRTSGPAFDPQNDEPFIRDAFDALFDNFERLEHFVGSELIVFADVEQPLSYYVERLSRPEEYAVARTFLRTYGFRAAEAFLSRFQAWKSAREADAIGQAER
jgi:hypothetical protein